jgi:flavin reductase (DIM6/NTAB) family NADH-FMN oxidoreductase RutF
MIDADRFRVIMSSTPTPVTVVTTSAQQGPVGATVSAFMSISLEPTLVAVSLRRGSRIAELVGQTGAYGVNLLSEKQSELALRFAGPMADRFADLRWMSDCGLPRLEESAAWLACEVDVVYDGGDHQIFIGQVLRGWCRSVAPLVYSHRMFGTNSSMQTRIPTPVEEQAAALCRIDG